MPKHLKLLNIKQTQQHPFHVLHSSKLPMFMSLFAGSTALIFIAKLHAISYVDSFGYSFIASQLLAPFFEIGNLSYASINMLVLFSLICSVIVMGA